MLKVTGTMCNTAVFGLQKTEKTIREPIRETQKIHIRRTVLHQNYFVSPRNLCQIPNECNSFPLIPAETLQAVLESIFHVSPPIHRSFINIDIYLQNIPEP